MEEQEVYEIIHLGDVFDNRKHINLLTAHMANKHLFLGLTDAHVLIGNHDCYYNNSNRPNSPALLGMGGYSQLYVEPTETQISDAKVLLLPWINAENRDATFKLIERSTAKLCFGHLAIAGFVMDQGRINEDGLDASMFRKFAGVYSGHFHTKSDRDNIHYLGAHCQFSWGDYGEPRGFHILDTNTLELTYFKNPYSIFHMIVYDDKTKEEIEDIDYNQYYDCFVRVVILNKKDQYLFDIFSEKLYNASPANISLVEGSVITEKNEQGEDVITGVNVEDTPTILNAYIDNIETTLEKPKVKSTMTDIYNEAKLMEGE